MIINKTMIKLSCHMNKNDGDNGERKPVRKSSVERNAYPVDELDLKIWIVAFKWNRIWKSEYEKFKMSFLAFKANHDLSVNTIHRPKTNQTCISGSSSFLSLSIMPMGVMFSCSLSMSPCDIKRLIVILPIYFVFDICICCMYFVYDSQYSLEINVHT